MLKHAPAVCVKDISRDEALEIKNKLDLAAKAKARGQPVKPPAWEQRDEGVCVFQRVRRCLEGFLVVIHDVSFIGSE